MTDSKKASINISIRTAVNEGGTAPQKVSALSKNEADLVEVDASDVIKLILQFLSENKLRRTFHSLQEESGVFLGIIDNPDQFVQEIIGGNTTRLLEVCGEVALPQTVLYDVFEHVALELMEQGNKKSVNDFIGSTHVFESMRNDDPLKYRRILAMSEKMGRPTKEELWGTTSKYKRRKQVARAVTAQAEIAPPSRLLALLNLAIKMQRANGLVGPSARYDLFRGLAATDRDEHISPPTVIRHTITLASEKSKVFAGVFSPDGFSFVTGDSSGDVLVWSWMSGTLRTDLEYQKNEYFMFHEGAKEQPVAVTALAMSLDGKLASGDAEGNIKIWDISTGQLLRGPLKLHTSSITSIEFHPTEARILTTSTDGTAKISYPVTGIVAKTFDGHDGFVTGGFFDGVKGSMVVTASSDGMIRLFSSKQDKMIKQFAPPSGSSAKSSVEGLAPHRDLNHQFYAVCGEQDIYCMDTDGRVLKTFKSTVSQTPATWSHVATSPQAEWLACQSTQGDVLFFEAESAKMQGHLPQLTKEGAGLAYHDSQNVMAAWGGREVIILEP